MRKDLTNLRGVKCLYHVADDFFILLYDAADPSASKQQIFLILNYR
jgi:hypothetical protein